MNQSIERTALTNLITNEDYAKKVLPFIKKDYFDGRGGLDVHGKRKGGTHAEDGHQCC